MTQRDSKTVVDHSADNSIPTAATESSVKMQFGSFSSMWWLTLACLLLAAGLVWWSLPERGVSISVRFPEGHGLQPEDQVLYRGIEVGVVEEVQLSDDQEAIDVMLKLTYSAAKLAREGTRFWIVRPQLSLSGVTGLETAVGHKYVSLSPGPLDSARKYAFEGLLEPPPEDAASPGIEIVIRGDERNSISPGSTVTFRGVEVGRILSVGLSQDSRYVDVRAKIFDRFRQNLTTSSKFWATSGINVDFSLAGGLSVNTESLASIAQGGVSFLTIDNSGEPVPSGHVFRLYSEPDDNWMAAADSVSATTVELGGVISMRRQWQQKGLLGRRNKAAGFNGMPVQMANGEKRIILPMDAVQFSEKALPETAAIVALVPGGDESVEPEAAIRPISEGAEFGFIAWPTLGGIDWLNAQTDFRKLGEPESCVAVRSVVNGERLSFLHYPIEQSYLRDDWTLPNFDGDRELWHGATVLSINDGKVLGALLVSDDLARVSPVVLASGE